MELITPGWGLLLWQVLILITIILFVASWMMILTTKTFDSRDRLSWLLGTLLLPLVGPVLFFIKRRSRKSGN